MDESKVQWVRVKEASEAVGIHERTIRRAVGRDEIRSKRTGGGKTSAIMVNVDEVNRKWKHLKRMCRSLHNDESVQSSNNAGNIPKPSQIRTSKGSKSTDIEKQAWLLLKKQLENKDKQLEAKDKQIDTLNMLVSQQQQLQGQLQQKLLEAPRNGLLSRMFTRKQVIEENA